MFHRLRAVRRLHGTEATVRRRVALQDTCYVPRDSLLAFELAGTGLRLGEPETLGDSPEERLVVLASFLREAEECEEDERTTRENPTSELGRDIERGVRTPDECWDLLDVPELVVGDLPGDPWVHMDAVVVDPHVEYRKGNVECHVDEGEQEQAEVPADRHRLGS